MLLRVLSAKTTTKSTTNATPKLELPETLKMRQDKSLPTSDDDSTSSDSASRSSCSSVPSSDTSSSAAEESPKFPVKETRRLIKLCNELLEILNVLDPGSSVNRGRVLKELIGPVMKLSQHELDAGEIDSIEFKLRKMYCSKLAKDLVECYKYEFI